MHTDMVFWNRKSVLRINNLNNFLMFIILINLYKNNLVFSVISISIIDIINTARNLKKIILTQQIDTKFLNLWNFIL